mgnify:CR=1 FL=1
MVNIDDLKNRLMLALKSGDSFASSILVHHLLEEIGELELSNFLIEEKFIEKKCYFCKIKCDNPECDLEPARNSIDKGIKND